MHEKMWKKIFVGVQGIEPCASASRTLRATDAPHPAYIFKVLLYSNLNYSANG
jgi:hypothetical protein